MFNLSTLQVPIVEAFRIYKATLLPPTVDEARFRNTLGWVEISSPPSRSETQYNYASRQHRPEEPRCRIE